LSTLIAKAKREGKLFLNPVPTTVGNPSMYYKGALAYLGNKEERTPKRPPGPFSTDARVFEARPASGLRITWLGHSTLLIEIEGLRILTDPMWEERASPVEWAGPKRFFAPPLPLESLPPIDVVLISHDHYDHLGANTVRTLSAMSAASRAKWIAPLGVGRILQSFGVKPGVIQEVDWTDSVSLPNLTITALPARHFSGRGVFNRFETLWASCAISGSRHRVYHGADSGEWPGFEEIGRSYGPFDISLLEIGAYDPLWADIHMGPDGAARTFHRLGGTGLLMPIHWGLFDLALHAWRQPIERLRSIGDLKLWSPRPGEPTEVQAGVPLMSEWWR
jgi:L-ascorbate metabolism protein UlaG (beta-lactamase superfamily)